MCSKTINKIIYINSYHDKLIKMCGIFATFTFGESNKLDYSKMKNEIYNMLRNRGPDSVGYLTDKIKSTDGTIFMLHTRLKINGDDTTQPLVHGNKILIINGEIFNWRELGHELEYNCHSSDCEIIFPLYDKYKHDLKTFFEKLNGQYSFVLYDKDDDILFVGRDHIGVTPLYVSTSKTEDEQYLMFSSELKCLDKYSNKSTEILVFPPRTYIYTKLSEICGKGNEDVDLKKHMIEYMNYSNIPQINNYNYENVKKNIKNKLINSVKSQLQDLVLDSSPDFGVLLSGGLDSSLIASITTKLCKQMGYNKRIKTFSIGVDSNAPDLVAARQVAKFLDSEHYEYYFSLESGINNLENLIWSIESYDCTTIRASTPMYFLTKQIHENFPKLKVILSGELSDELLCYLYGANAPSPDEFQKETIKLVNNVHLFDCLRANKTCMANSLEVRVPFADKHYVEYVISLPPEIKMFGEKLKKMEKQILRESFSDDFLPDVILWRKKEQFSDGVSGFNSSNNWIDGVRNYTNSLYADNDVEDSNFSYNKPDTKEKLYYREIFSRLFKNETSQKLVEEWVPNWSESKDPSGRVQNFWQIN